MARILEKINIAIIFGTRPEAIRLYHTIRAIEPEHILWTGQNYSKNLSDDILYDPRFGNTYKNIDRHNTQEATEFHEQFSYILKACYTYLYTRKPEKVLILGDTNSSLAAALAAKKLGIPLYHMEAGNRCYNDESPEEVNRKMIDSIADVHLCYTQFAKQNLLSEGVSQNKIHVIGNPMAEFPEFYNTKDSGYVLIDLHRAENEKYLDYITSSLSEINYPKKLVLHPRFFSYFKSMGFDVEPSTNFSTFIDLEKNASLIITDSGTVCEEAYLLRKPCIILRETTERPELLESGFIVLCHPTSKLPINDMFETNIASGPSIPEYQYSTVSEKVKRILQGTSNVTRL